MMAISSKNNKMDLDKLAEEELLRESERAKARFEVIGIEGFRKCPVPRTNKRFLVNTIINNIKSNSIYKSKSLTKRKHSSKALHTKYDKKPVSEKTDLKDTSEKEKGSKEYKPSESNSARH